MIWFALQGNPKAHAAVQNGVLDDMVYVNAKLSQVCRHVGSKLTAEQVWSVLMDLGMDVKDISGDTDPTLKVELTAEKMDMVSVVGIARAIKYYLGQGGDAPKYKIAPATLRINADKSVAGVRPKIAAAIVRGLKMDKALLDELIELQEKVHDSFGRGRKKAAIGIYPLNGIAFPLEYRAEPPSKIKFTPLGARNEMSAREILEMHDAGRKYGHLLEGCGRYPLLADSKGSILSMPPIINSETSGSVTEGCSDVLIECTGHNLTHLDSILKVLVTTLIELGGSAESVEVVYPDGKYSLSLEGYADTVSAQAVNKLIGTSLTPNEMAPLLERMMYRVGEMSGDKISVVIPPFRSDVWNDVDIADDIARAYGYNNIIPRVPRIISTGGQLPFTCFMGQVSENMCSMGFIELYTYMLTSNETQFSKMLIRKWNSPHITNSAEQGINTVRQLILPEHLASLHVNRRSGYPQKVFENGLVVERGEDGRLVDAVHLCASIAGPKSNYTGIKEAFGTMCSLNRISFTLRESRHPFFIEGRQADIIVKGKKIGFIGEVHPQVLDNFGLLVPVASFELCLSSTFQVPQQV